MLVVSIDNPHASLRTTFRSCGKPLNDSTLVFLLFMSEWQEENSSHCLHACHTVYCCVFGHKAAISTRALVLPVGGGSDTLATSSSITRIVTGGVVFSHSRIKDLERAWVCCGELVERYIVQGIDRVWVQLGVKKLANKVRKVWNIEPFCELIYMIGITSS